MTGTEAVDDELGVPVTVNGVVEDWTEKELAGGYVAVDPAPLAPTLTPAATTIDGDAAAAIKWPHSFDPAVYVR